MSVCLTGIAFSFRSAKEAQDFAKKESVLKFKGKIFGPGSPGVSVNENVVVWNLEEILKANTGDSDDKPLVSEDEDEDEKPFDSEEECLDDFWEFLSDVWTTSAIAGYTG